MNAESKLHKMIKAELIDMIINQDHDMTFLKWEIAGLRAELEDAEDRALQAEMIAHGCRAA